MVLPAVLAGGGSESAAAETPAAATSAAADAAGRMEWLAPSIRVGRNELQIARFRDDRAPPVVLQELTSAWERRQAPIQRSAEAGWLVAVQADGEWIETIRVRADGDGAAGMRIRQRLAVGSVDDSAFPVERYLPEARVVNRTDQPGPGRTVTSWVLTSSLQPASLIATARTEGRRAGYSEDLGQGPGAGPLWLRRSAEEIVITVTPGLQGSVAVVHWSRKP